MEQGWNGRGLGASGLEVRAELVLGSPRSPGPHAGAGHGFSPWGRGAWGGDGGAVSGEIRASRQFLIFTLARLTNKVALYRVRNEGDA